MGEQMSLFDLIPEMGQRVSFKRYIGQRVHIRVGGPMAEQILTGRISKIEDFYTTVRVGREDFRVAPDAIAEARHGQADEEAKTCLRMS